MGALADLLAHGVVVLDGGLSTALAGHDLSGARWTAGVLEREPEAVAAAHGAFVDAGAQVVISASYQLGDDTPELLAASVRVARAAAGGRALVAASVGPYGALLAGGQEYTGDYPDGVDLAGFHRRRLEPLLAAGPDCVACETLPRADEAALVVDALQALGGPDAWVSFSCRDGAHTAHGERIEDAVAAVAGRAPVVAVGVNCTAAEHVGELLRRARTVTDLPLVAYPNAGREWDAQARVWRGAAAAATLAPALVREWTAAGARLVGGCCGFGPDGIAALADSLRGGD